MITILCIAAVYRLTFMLKSERGPWAVFERLRAVFINPDNMEPKNTIGEGLQCFYCLSVWVAAPFAVYLACDVYQFFIYLLALSAGAIILNVIVEEIES